MLHKLLDELDSALGHVRDAIGHDLGPIDGVLAKLRTHADAEAQLLEEKAIADGKQILSDAEPVVQEVAKDGEDLAETAVSDVDSLAGDVTESAPAPSTPAEPASPAQTPAPAETTEAAAPSDAQAEPETDAAPADTPAA
ncbi:MAG: hypothetical protein ACRDVE_20610 [Actinocrinis sp.]